MTMENLNLSHLTPAERERILAVLKRNDSLERKDQERVKKIQTEVKQLKLKGVIKEGINADKTCARCRSELGIFFNRGALCPQCHAKVCPQCRQNSEKAEEGWLCSLCYKQLELEIQSGKWFYKKLHEKNNRNKVLKGSELVKVSIRRPQNGNATGRSTAANDVKQSLSNNNASPKPHHHSPASVHGSAAPIGGDRDHVDGLHGDKGHGGSIHQVGFPRDSDRRRLMDLLKPHSDLSSTEGGESPSVNRRKQVKQVHSGRYKDSDSDSLSSGPSSPQISSSRTHTGSVQSSVLSSDRAVHSDMNSEIDSIHSSPRLLSGQTGLPMVTTNYRSNNVLSHSPSSRSGRLVESSTASTLEDTTPSRDGHPERSRVSSSSSESEEEFVVEELSRIKFRKCSTKRSINGSYGITSSPSLDNRSPSPSPSSRSRKGHEQDTAVKPADSEVIMAAYEGDIMYGVKTSSAEEPVKPALPQEPVPVISVTQEYVDDTESHRSSPRSMRSTGLKEASDAQSQSSHIPSPIKSDQSSLNPDDSTEDPDFDELFRSHTSSQHSSTVNDSPRSSNLLTPLSDSHESISSVYSDAGEGHFGKVDITGEIQFALEYNYKSSVLEIRIKQCKDLAAVDKKRNRSDPYVKTYLLPDKTKSGKRKTRVKKHTLNPTFEETLKYNITKSELETRSLWISVWHGDRLGRNAFLGEVNLPMDYHNFDNISPSWHTLQDRKPQGISLLTYKGDLVLSIKYVPAESVPNRKKNRVSSRGELLVLVKEARNLTAVRANGFSDPFCKCYLLPDRTKGGKQKTGVMKKNCNPRWNHCFLFENVTVIDLKERCLELTIWDYDRLTSNDFLGGLRLSLGTGRSRGREVDWMDARGEEISLWQSMLDRPNVWIEGNLMLRPNMDKRVSSA